MLVADGATVIMNDCTISNNVASILGGGLYLDSSSATLEKSKITGNNATANKAAGSAAYLEYGALYGTDLEIDGDIGSAFASSSATCGSSCAPGQYGSCEVVSGAQDCFVNCDICNSCPAGRASPAEGSTSLEDCTACATGQAAANSAQCSSCTPGTFAANGTQDQGGGLVTQTLFGASACNPCPAGFFSSVSSAIVCQE